MDPKVVREALVSAESALLAEDLQKVEDKAQEVADLFRKSSQDWTLGEADLVELKEALTIRDHVCEKLTGNLNLLEQTLFTLVPPLVEMTFVLETFRPRESTEKVLPLLRLIATSCNAREAVLLFNQLVPVFKR
jgi:hypothetical protein